MTDIQTTLYDFIEALDETQDIDATVEQYVRKLTGEEPKPLGSVVLVTSVPVYVEVDLDSREVLKVVAADEEVSSDYASCIEDDYMTPVYGERVQLATEIAEKAMWPAWDFSW